MKSSGTHERVNGRGRLLGLFAGLASSLVLMSTVFYRWELHGGLRVIPRFSFVDLLRELPRNVVWLVPFVLLTALLAPLRAFQWQSTLRSKVPFATRYHLVALSGMVNNVFPGKVGDVFRALLLARGSRLSALESLGTVAVCKLLELVAMLGLASVSLLWAPAHAQGHFSRLLRPGLFGSALLLALVLVLAHFARPMAHLLAKRRQARKWRRFLGRAGRGFHSAKSPGRFSIALAYSALPVLASALAYGFGLRTLGATGVWAGPLTLLALSLGEAIAGPAAVGAYYLVTAWAARTLGVPAEQAAAYAMLTHLATAATQVAMGGLSAPALKLTWSDLKASTAGGLDARLDTKESGLCVPPI